MPKSRIIRDICALLESQLTVMQTAAKEAHQNATGDETRSEGKYDTRAIEASYPVSYTHLTLPTICSV